MKRFIWAVISWLTLIALPDTASAQRRFVPGQVGGVGVGIGVGPQGAYGPFVSAFPGFGFFPTYYNGFYGNGFSAYGPPVPTYGSIPGVFGGYDQRNYGTPPGIFGPRYGYGYGLYRGGYRRPNANHFTPNFSTSAPGLSEQTPNLNESPLHRPMHIEVHCRTDAMIQIDRKDTTQTGSTRVYITPSISTEEEVTYEVRASWEEDGKYVTRLRAATGKGGGRVLVDFTSTK